MADAPPDRHDVSLPAQGPIGADDLRRVRFPLALRGYRMAEVDALLERLIREREDAVPEPASAGEPAGEPADEPSAAPVAGVESETP